MGMSRLPSSRIARAETSFRVEQSRHIPIRDHVVSRRQVENGAGGSIQHALYPLEASRTGDDGTEKTETQGLLARGPRQYDVEAPAFHDIRRERANGAAVGIVERIQTDSFKQERIERSSTRASASHGAFAEADLPSHDVLNHQLARAETLRVKAHRDSVQVNRDVEPADRAIRSEAEGVLEIRRAFRFLTDITEIGCCRVGRLLRIRQRNFPLCQQISFMIEN